MDYTSLNYFMSMARHLNFTKAANDCHVVQSTMSKQIAALEKELGIQLFYRDSHSVRLTPAGQRLSMNAERYANQYRAINTSVHKLMIDYDDTLKIGCGLFESHTILKPIKSFTSSYPNVEFNYMQYSYSTLVAHTRTGVVDAAVGTELCANAVKDEVQSIPLFEDKWIVAANENSDFWRMTKEEQAVLHDQLVITTYNNEYEPVRAFCLTNGFRQRAFSYSNFNNPIITMLQADAGVAVFPSSMRPFVPANVRMEDTFEKPMKIKFVLLYKEDCNSIALSRFIECCKRHFNIDEGEAQNCD
ncbi:MAG: HTH-type transcriptional regulator GltC [Betaproteobacteria bacterium ADurb.Bin341]|nr:MAG: HTH-type transcriptional regulator GltC [Betaproteobacteria bacterium ADurb.Bin341]HOG02319.1 LysR family transcriptional regulator [Clostridia bacterium]HPK16904.1 LysR family transcriptional regulator [Clostridia bacterium]